MSSENPGGRTINLSSWLIGWGPPSSRKSSLALAFLRSGRTHSSDSKFRSIAGMVNFGYNRGPVQEGTDFLGRRGRLNAAVVLLGRLGRRMARQDT